MGIHTHLDGKSISPNVKRNMKKEHRNDISVGKDQWIIFEDLENQQDDAIEIDHYMEVLMPMWQALETQCVAGCCGIDAFDLWPNDVLENTADLDHKKLLRELKALRETISNFDKKIVVSSRLNNYFTKNTFLKLLDHLYSIYENA